MFSTLPFFQTILFLLKSAHSLCLFIPSFISASLNLAWTLRGSQVSPLVKWVYTKVSIGSNSSHSEFSFSCLQPGKSEAFTVSIVRYSERSCKNIQATTSDTWALTLLFRTPAIMFVFGARTWTFHSPLPCLLSVCLPMALITLLINSLLPAIHFYDPLEPTSDAFHQS